jgi:hypothetical protein
MAAPLTTTEQQFIWAVLSAGAASTLTPHDQALFNDMYVERPSEVEDAIRAWRRDQ